MASTIKTLQKRLGEVFPASPTEGQMLASEILLKTLGIPAKKSIWLSIRCLGGEKNPFEKICVFNLEYKLVDGSVPVCTVLYGCDCAWLRLEKFILIVWQRESIKTNIKTEMISIPSSPVLWFKMWAKASVSLFIIYQPRIIQPI